MEEAQYYVKQQCADRFDRVLRRGETTEVACTVNAATHIYITTLRSQIKTANFLHPGLPPLVFHGPLRKPEASVSAV